MNQFKIYKKNIVKLLQIMYDIQFKHKHANVSMIKINKILLLRKFIKIKNIIFFYRKKNCLKNYI